jgi:hypothetical protein
MFSVCLSTRDCHGHVIVVLRGQLDVADAARVAAAVPAVAACEPEMIVGLAGRSALHGRDMIPGRVLGATGRWLGLRG